MAADLRLVYGGASGRRGQRHDAPVPLVGHENGAEEAAEVPARGATAGMQGSRGEPEEPSGVTGERATSKSVSEGCNGSSLALRVGEAFPEPLHHVHLGHLS